MTYSAAQIQNAITGLLNQLGAQDLDVSVTPPPGAPVNPQFTVSVSCSIPETQLNRSYDLSLPEGWTITINPQPSGTVITFTPPASD